MSAAHTPGPWHSLERNPSSGLFIRGGPHHYPIAKAQSYHAGPGPRSDEALANLDLMAASPDILEALEETWRVLRAAGLMHLASGVQLGQTSWYVKICDAEIMSDAAIAKALGRTPNEIGDRCE